MKKVIIIGSGIAGLSAAIRSAQLNNQVTLVSPYPSERAQSVMAAGGINAVLNPEDSKELHINDTIKGGCFLEEEAIVEGLVERAPSIISWLNELGCTFNKTPDGSFAQRPFGGQSFKRTCFAGSSTGKHIVTALVNKCREYEAKGLITKMAGYRFISALISEKCDGVVVENINTGDKKALYGHRVIMATGGLNGLYGKTTGSRLSDGYATARLFSQGVTLKNLEFVQYHPTAIETAQKKMLVSEAVRGEGARLYYFKDNQKIYFMEEAYGPKGNLMPRDIVSRHIYNAPSQVYLETSVLDKKIISERLQEVKDTCKEYLDLDIVRNDIPVTPAAHYFMGGIAVDKNHRTNISGLYAAGECASIYHGANRLGGNSLLGAIYGGLVAAEDQYSDVTEPKEVAVNDEINTPTYNTKAIQILNEKAGIVRNEEGLLAGLKVIDKELKSDKSAFYQLILSKAILMAALSRKESRGAHYRSDYPEAAEEKGKPSYITYEAGEIKVQIGENR